MSDVIVLIWVGFVFFAAVILSGISIVYLVQNKKIGFDKGFGFSLSACLVAVMLCLSLWPPVHRIYDDESTYISQSVNILSIGKPSIILKGTRLKPEILGPWTDYPKLPGFAWLEAVVLFLTKDFEHGYFILNIILGALSVAVVYRIAWLLSANHAMAWWSAIFWACLPVRITYAMSAASDIAGSFFFFLFILFLIEYRSLKAKRILYAALFCGIYSICIKQFYIIPVFGGIMLALRVYQRDGFLDKKRYSQILLDTICLSLPILSAIPIFLFSDSMKGGYSFSFICKNISTSVHYLLDYKQSTLLTALAALVCVGRSIFYKKDDLVFGLAAWLLIGIVAVSLFYAGGFSYPGQAYSDRYFLPLAFPFVYLAAKGMVHSVIKVYPFFLGAVFFIILIVNAFVASHHLDNEAKDNFHYKKSLLLKQAFQFIPKEVYILDGNASFIAMIGPEKSIQMDLFLGGDYPEKVVFMQGISDDQYNSDDPERMTLVKNILNVKYRCKPLMAAPLKEADLSATPFLCTRK